MALGLRGSLPLGLGTAAALLVVVAALGARLLVERRSADEAEAALGRAAREARGLLREPPSASDPHKLQRLVDSIRRDGEVEARVLDESGRDLATSDPAFASRIPPRMRRALPLGAAGGGGGELVLELGARDDARVRALADVTLGAVILGVGAVLFAMAAGFLLARRLASGLEALTDAADAVRAGEPEPRVQVSSPAELAELADAFNAMLADLGESKARLIQAERVAAWQEIARGLAHELKNPLTPIQMSVETLRKSRAARHPEFDEIFEESTRTVLEEVARLKKIIGEFSSFARLPRAEPHRADLGELARAAMALYQGAVRVVSDLAPELPPVRVDRDQLTQVILNLLENARDAIAARGSEQSIGRITVRTRSRTEAGATVVELTVEDNGPGFDPELKERLFESYFTTKTGGTGLGLAIVRRIVTDHGGRVIASATGAGARFTIELPAWTGQTGPLDEQV